MPEQHTFKQDAPKIAMVMRARWKKEKARADQLQQEHDEVKRHLGLVIDALGLVLIGRSPCSICSREDCPIKDPTRSYCLFPHRFTFEGCKEVSVDAE